MGYNQQNAGMHFIRFRRQYAPYDDLEYYDKLAERQQNNTDKIIRTEITGMLPETGGKSDKPTEHTQKKEAPITMSKEKVSPSHKQKKKEVSLSFKKHTNITYGTETVIDIHHYLGIGYIVPANIMMIALQKKMDIHQIMDECEKLAASDKYLNPSPEETIYACQKVERSLAFLSLLAEKMQCSVYEFFINDKEHRKQFVYSFLNEVTDDQWDMDLSKDCVDEETGDAEFILSNFDYFYGMTSTIKSDFTQSMGLIIEKNKFPSGKTSYAMGFGNLNINIENDNDFMLKGAYIWEEEEGKLQEYAEHLIELCKKMD